MVDSVYFRPKIPDLLSARIESIEARGDARIEENLEPRVKKIVAEEVAPQLFEERKKGGPDDKPAARPPVYRLLRFQ